MKAVSTLSGRSVHAAFLAFAAVSALLFQIGATRAQTADPDAFSLMMNNHLGILKYCQGKGFVSEKPIATYEKYIASMPAPSDAAKAAIYLKKGQEGIVYNGEDSQLPLDQVAEGTSQTPEAFCKSYEENAKVFENAQ